jgi:hypothetical protein
MQLNRVVALATPLFAAAAGWVSTWLAENIPGVSIDEGALEEIFIAGALVALAPAAQWLHGWQKYEARKAEAQQAVEIANAAPPTLIAVEQDVYETGFDESPFDEFGDLDELEDLADLEDLDELDEGLLDVDEEPARTGG